mgnify:FL=1
MKKITILKVKAYKYEWTTAEEIIANMNTRVEFPTFGIGTLVEICGATNPDTYRKAHELWLKLKAAFNAEAATYDPKAYDSALGSVGSKTRREVMRSAWWDELSDLDESYYSEVTTIIEILHDYEKLATGRILFGS